MAGTLRAGRARAGSLRSNGCSGPDSPRVSWRTCCGACSRSTGRCWNPPARSRSSRTGSCGRWSCVAVLLAVDAGLSLGPPTSGAAARCCSALAAALITVNWGALHLGRQQRPRRRDLARLLHQSAGHGRAGVPSLGERLRRAQWVAVGDRGRWRSSCWPSATAGRPGSRSRWPSPSASTAWSRSRSAWAGRRAWPSRPTFLVLPALGCLAVAQATGEGTFTSEGAGQSCCWSAAGSPPRCR